MSASPSLHDNALTTCTNQRQERTKRAPEHTTFTGQRGWAEGEAGFRGAPEKAQLADWPIGQPENRLQNRTPCAGAAAV